jgi:hypothetical protein
MRVFNEQCISNRSQRSVGCVEKHVCTHIVLRPDPFSFQYSPKCFRNIQVRGIWRKIEKEKPSFLPYGTQLSYFMITMNRSIVKHHKRVFEHTQGKCIEEIHNLVGIDTFGGGKSIILVVSVNHSEDVEPCASLRCNAYILPRQLPAVRNIPFGADMALISIVQGNTSFTLLPFKFLQLFILILVKLRRGYSPWAFSYTLISCANADKKRLKVKLLASFPVACCQAILARLTLCLSCSMAARTACSSEQSMIGFRPRPSRVCKPVMPSERKRFTHALTDTKLISVCSPAFAEESPSDLRRTARQRMRKQWLVPWRKPCSNSKRWTLVNSIVFIFPIANRIYLNTGRTESIIKYCIN